MAYIGKVKMAETWEKVEDLIKQQVGGQSSFAFDADTTYQLQCEGDLGVRLCDSAMQPTDSTDGMMIRGTQTAMYKPGSATTLYARISYETNSDMLLKISTVGE